jgi:hypothetical protein
MAKVKKVSSLVKLSMTLLILTALPVTVISFNNLSYTRSKASSTLPGSQLPNGAHYNLNVIGVPKGSTPNISSGNILFIPLSGKTLINLSIGDFVVTDVNGTDGKVAFNLPSPDLDKDGSTDYSLWIKATGQLKGKSARNNCADDPVNGEIYCSTSQMISVPSSGKPSQTFDISRDFLYIYLDINGDGTAERYQLFDDALKDNFWQYDNHGQKISEMRIYEMPSTTVSSP